MPRDFQRTDRIGDQIQKDLAMLIQQEIKDPRLQMVTINAVKVSKDLSYADVYFTALGANLEESETEQHKASEKVLAGAAGFLRTELGRGLRLRVIPQLRFHYDVSVERGNKMSRLIDEAVKTDKPDSEA